MCRKNDEDISSYTAHNTKWHWFEEQRYTYGTLKFTKKMLLPQDEEWPTATVQEEAKGFLIMNGAPWNVWHLTRYGSASLTGTGCNKVYREKVFIPSRVARNQSTSLCIITLHRHHLKDLWHLLMWTCGFTYILL